MPSGFRLLRLVVDLDAGLVADGANYLVAAGNDLLVSAEAVNDFNIRGAGDTGLHLPEDSLLSVNDENALQFLLTILFAQLFRGVAVFTVAGLAEQVALLP